MSYYFKIFYRALALILLCVLLGFILLIAAFQIPTDRMETHVTESASIFDAEGNYPNADRYRQHSPLFQLDNFTDSIMLMNAAYEAPTGLIDRVLMVYKPSIPSGPAFTPPEILVEHYLNGNEDITPVNYFTYWHGYLTVLKPALYLFNYGQLRIVNTVCIIAVTVVLAALMLRKGLKNYVLPYLIALLWIYPNAIGKSLQFSSMFYVFTLSTILLLLLFDWLEKDSIRIPLFFVLIGCATSFFDFLTYPMATFGVPMLIYICKSSKSLKEKFKLCIVSLICWGAGYGLMWAGKWVLGTIFTDTNFFEKALHKIQQRSSMTDGYSTRISAYDIMHRHIDPFMSKVFVFSPAGVLFILYCFFAAFRIAKLQRLRNIFLSREWLLFLLVAILPFCWFLFAANHSYIHFWFTYRAMIVSVFAFLCVLGKYSAKTKAQARES